MQGRSCPHCEKNIMLQEEVCPHCNKAVAHYPSFSPKWFMVLWVFFLVLIVGLLVSMFGSN